MDYAFYYFYMLVLIPEMRKIFSLCLILLHLGLFLHGQHYSPGYTNADPDWLEQFLYNGAEWRPTYQQVTGHEFFFTKEYLTGDITLEGIRFRDIRMRYDISGDYIIILWQTSFPIALLSERIDEFTIRYEGKESRFVNFRNIYPQFNGFAEVLYSGSGIFVARHTKTISYNSSLSSYAQFMDYTKYYYMVNGICTQIRSRRTFLKLMGDYEHDVKKYIRQNGIFLSTTSPAGFGIAAAYYDSLIARENTD